MYHLGLSWSFEMTHDIQWLEEIGSLQMLGAFRSFQEGTVGDLHLRQLAKAGISHVHLLPSFDFGSVPERPEERKEPELPSASAVLQTFADKVWIGMIRLYNLSVGIISNHL